MKRHTPAARRLSARPRKTGRRKPGDSDIEAKPVTAAELRALRREIERRMKPKRPDRPLRWNPEPEDVQRSVAQLVLTLAEFLRRLMERQAIRRMEQKTLTDEQIEAVGTALETLEETIVDMGKRFGLAPEDLNLDLGPIKLM